MFIMIVIQRGLSYIPRAFEFIQIASDLAYLGLSPYIANRHEDELLTHSECIQVACSDR